MWAAQFSLSSYLEINFRVFPQTKKAREVMSGKQGGQPHITPQQIQ
jgi:hypothetical protein